MTEPVRGPDLSGLKIDARARRIPANRRWVLLSAGLVALLLVAGGLYAFLREAVAEVEVATVRADKGGRPTLLNASGYVTPRQRATIAAKITARVNEIFVDEGMQVEPGQVLARLDDSDARARLTSASAEREATAATLGELRVNLENAERELRRVDGHRADRRHGLAGDRGGRERVVHRAGEGGAAGHGRPRRISGLAGSGQGAYRDPDGRPPEGDGQGASDVRSPRPAHPSRHGR